MKKTILFGLLSLALMAGIVLIAPPILTSPGLTGETATDNTPIVTEEYAVIELKDPPMAVYLKGQSGDDHGKKDFSSPAARDYKRHLGRSHDHYRRWLDRQSNGAKIIREYFVTANGFAVQLNGASLSSLAAGPGVKRAAYSGIYRPANNVGAGLIGADLLWSTLGGAANAGAGTTIAVLDTGIDDTHPIFACKDEIPHKLFVSGNAGDTSNVLAGDHGSHVAGTAAGCVTTLTEGPINGTISGVAPAASLADYNIMPGFGACYTSLLDYCYFEHDFIAAMEEAVLDGVDIISLSLQGGVRGPHDTVADSVNAAVDAGVAVVACAGNFGPGDSTIGSPGSAEKAITAGASTNPHFIGIPLTVSNVGTFGAATGDFLSFSTSVSGVPFSLTNPANGCTAITDDLSGQLAVIDRGACSFSTKIRNAEAAGADGVVIVNNVAGDPFYMVHDNLEFPTISAVMVSMNDGAAIKSAASVELMDIDGSLEMEILSSNADINASFASQGPVPYTALIKPDVTAPGVNVYSSIIGGEYEMMSGCSMATPHVAGTVSILMQKHPDWSLSDIKSALINTAERSVTDRYTGTVDPGVLSRGGGRVYLPYADSTPVTLDPPSVSFGYWSGNKNVTGSMDILVKNVSAMAQSCTVSITGPAIASVSQTALNLDAGETTTVNVTLEAGQSRQTPSGDYDGDILVNCDGMELRAPWWVRINRQGKK